MVQKMASGGLRIELSLCVYAKETEQEHFQREKILVKAKGSRRARAQGWLNFSLSKKISDSSPEGKEKE